MQANKHQVLAAAGADLAAAVGKAARVGGVTVDEVVREALQRGERPTAARAAYLGLPEAMRRRLSKLVGWPWDCTVCTAAVAEITYCTGGHLQCQACVDAPCPLCALQVADAATRNARNERGAAQARVAITKAAGSTSEPS